MSPGVLGWTYVVAGTILIGIGGLLTTLGWNRLAAQDQQANAMRSLVREVDLNGQMIQAALELTRRWPTRSDGASFSYEIYQATQLTAVVTSGALDPRDALDRELLDSLERYERALSRFNSLLRIVGRTNPGIFIKTDLIHTTDAKAWPAEARAALADPFRELLDAHESARTLLQRRYRSAVGEHSGR